MWVRVASLCASLATAALAPLAAQDGASIRLVRGDAAVQVRVGDEPFADYVFAGGSRPIVWPLLAPGGVPVTRAWPMQEEAGAAVDHPHQRSLWFAHGDVNGVDFWTEGDKAGRIEQTELVTAEVVGDRGRIETRNRWSAPDGKVVCTDVRTFEFFVAGAMRGIDITVVIRASHGALHFGDTKEGTMAIRLPRGLCFDRKEDPGHAYTSEGKNDGDAWGTRARWIAYTGEVSGQAVGVVLMDHSANLRHPTWWHARNYGLLAANPFGRHDFEKARKGSGDFDLAAGEALTLRYRVLVFAGAFEREAIESSFGAFTKAPVSDLPQARKR